MAIKRRKLLAQGLNLGYGTDTIPSDSGGSLTGDKIGLHTFNSGSALNAIDKGVIGDGITDDYAAIMSALSVSDNVYLPGNKTYRVNTKITLRSGQCLFSDGAADRWRSGYSRAKIDYRGTGSAIEVKTASSGQIIDSVKLAGIQLDGTNTSGSVDGILLEADTGGGDAIELVQFDDCVITNFPRYQVRILGTVFRGIFRSCSMHNKDRSADHVIAFNFSGSGGAPGQFTFEDCFVVEYTAGKWCLFAGRDGTWTSNAVSDIVIHGGTWGPAASGAGGHGVWVYGGLQVTGTHIENFTETAQSATIGIRYTGSNGAVIAPASLSYFGTGLEIGNSAGASTEATGCVVLSGVGFNLTAGQDINIIATGNRRGTVIFPQGNFELSGSFGQTGGLIKVTNSATTAGDVFQIQSTAGTSGYTKLGSQMHLDDNNTRVGFGVAPSVRAHFRAANNDGLRLDNSSNSNRIGVQILNVSSQGQLLLYNSSESNRATLNGDGTSAFSTTGTATVDASAVMTLDSTTLGLLPPRMTTTQQNAISSPTKGLVIYNTSTDKLMVYTGSWTVIGTQT